MYIYEGTIVDVTPKGFGFILPDVHAKFGIRPRQIFFHLRDVVDRLTLKPGDRVSFQIQPSEKGDKAVVVILLGGAS